MKLKVIWYISHHFQPKELLTYCKTLSVIKKKIFEDHVIGVGLVDARRSTPFPSNHPMFSRQTASYVSLTNQNNDVRTSMRTTSASPPAALYYKKKPPSL
jgi:hypothetical protein